MIREAWVDGAITSPEIFNRCSIQLAAAARNFCGVGDIDSASQCIATYALARPHCSADPMRHDYAFVMSQMLLHRGLVYADMLTPKAHKAALTAVRLSHAAIEAQHICWPGHRWSFVRALRDYLLAKLKWLCDDSLENEVATPEEQIHWWVDSMTYIAEWALREPAIAAARSPEIKETLREAGLALIKMSLRYEPRRSARLIEMHNAQFGLRLPVNLTDVRTAGTRHWAAWELAVAMEATRLNPSFRLMDSYTAKSIEMMELQNDPERHAYLAQTMEAELEMLKLRAARTTTVELMGATN